VDNHKKILNIKRYDLSNDRSLRPHSAADELLLHQFNAIVDKPNQIAIYNDRFGFLSCYLNTYKPAIITTSKSQEKSISKNYSANQLPIASYVNPLGLIDQKIDFALIKVPKSIALFELFLLQILNNSSDNVTVIIAFMTRHFSPKLLTVSQKYFEIVKQSKAVKKARVATLTKKREVAKPEIIDRIRYNDKNYQQYLGVFSAKHIDYATQYFLDHIELSPSDNQILDLASGNGIIGNEILLKLPTAKLHLLDDSFLAVESAKLNVQGKSVYHYYDNDLSCFGDETFDLIVTNPPFHFEYEININIPIELFKDCHSCLKVGGNLQIVSSNHLNYQTHLKTIFPIVRVVSQNEKFTIYKCEKVYS